MCTTIVFIRHGETLWNRHKRYCGYRNIGLSARGKLQARELAVKLKNTHFDNIYSSDRLRALQTAKIVFPKSKFKITPGVKEIHFGVFEGLNHQQVMKKYPVIYSRWLDDPYKTTMPKAESLINFRKRVVKTIQKIALENKDKIVAIVCHGGVISTFLNYIREGHDFWRYIPASATVSIVEQSKNKKWKIICFNKK
ncbi:MAG: histidine phosphatase family protein [Candidatus Omnitrophica bacterium]|jgi:broad specificity phosphatase PhoE|nr:histidine phosphatase family protein [Candidatus Omnitrophota bacterium]